MLWRGLILFALVSVGLEVGIRLSPLRESLDVPFVPESAPFTVKVQLLDAYVSQHGELDCAVIGSSTVLRAFDPPLISAAYMAKTGRTLTCFNLGVPGLSDQGAAVLSDILIRHYHPRLIIFGVAFRDFVGDNLDLDAPWATTMAGQPSVSGWLNTESYAYRANLLYNDPVLTGVNWHEIERFRSTWTTLGYYTGYAIRVDVSQPPDPVRDELALTHNAPFDPHAAASRPGIQHFLSLQDAQTTLLVIEMPLPKTAYGFLPGGEPDNAAFIDQLEREAAAQHVTFWRTSGSVDVPAPDWYDFFHLNSKGAKILSAWLGGRLADAVLGGALPDPTR